MRPPRRRQYAQVSIIPLKRPGKAQLEISPIFYGRVADDGRAGHRQLLHQRDWR